MTPPRARWIGIDEAGYGPNLGPLVMTAVVAESLDDREPDLWNDLPDTVTRARGPADRLWIDDSKAILATRNGRTHLERTCRAAGRTVGLDPPQTLDALFRNVGAGGLVPAELDRWLHPDQPSSLQSIPDEPIRRIQCDRWRLTAIRSVVIGPARFNDRLHAADSKAAVHAEAFAELLRHAWTLAGDGLPTRLRSDKHGGRNFYAGLLSHTLPDAWVTPEIEGANLSRYTLKSPAQTLQTSFQPRADAHDGLVALASIVSKTLRERWMDAFNHYWTTRIPGLKPSAGYPVDARRFRAAIEPTANELNIHPSTWWRDR